MAKNPPPAKQTNSSGFRYFRCESNGEIVEVPQNGTLLDAVEIGIKNGAFSDGELRVVINADEYRVVRRITPPPYINEAKRLGAVPDARFFARDIELVCWLEMLVPKKDFETVFQPLIADREAEIRELQSASREKLSQFRIGQLRADLTLLYLSFVSTTLFKRIKTIWTLS